LYNFETVGASHNMYTISQFIEQLRGTPLGDTGTTIYDATLLRYISTLHSITE